MKIIQVNAFQLKNRKGSLAGFASVGLEAPDGNRFYIYSIRIIEKKDGGVFVQFPQRDKGESFKNREERYENIVMITNPLNKNIRDAIIDEYNKKFGGGNSQKVSDNTGSNDKKLAF